MKKIKKTVLISIFLCLNCFFVLFLNSCANAKKEIPQQIKDLKNSYSCVANIKYKDINAQATIDKENEGKCTVSFLSPESLKNMTATIDNGEIIVDYAGFSLNLSKNTPSSKMIANTIISAIESAAGDENLKITLEENLIKAKGTAGDSDYEIAVDGQSGVLAYLNFPKDEISVDFKDFRFVNN
ncbi:MAG: hypothetical protein RR549_02365 [Oscillospiraceae bacterium]